MATQTAISPAGEKDLELLDTLQKAQGELAAQIARRIVGQHDVIKSLVCAILSGGHVILIGVPGLAKTLLIQTLAQALDLTDGFMFGGSAYENR